MGVLLWAVDRWSARARMIGEVTMRDAVIVGFAQVLALIPGVSRSGSTITAGRFLKLDRPSAARFSFLMSMPITLAAVILKVPEAVRSEGISAPLVAGVIAAAISSWLAITVLPALGSPLLGMDVLGRLRWQQDAGVMKVELKRAAP